MYSIFILHPERLPLFSPCREQRCSVERGDQVSATAQISLVLEDDEASRFVLRVILEDAGFQVLESAQVGEAIDLCRIHPGSIAIMVSDVVLRGSAGTETVRQIHA